MLFQNQVSLAHIYTFRSMSIISIYTHIPSGFFFLMPTSPPYVDSQDAASWPSPDPLFAKECKADQNHNLHICLLFPSLPTFASSNSLHFPYSLIHLHWTKQALLKKLLDLYPVSSQQHILINGHDEFTNCIL